MQISSTLLLTLFALCGIRLSASANILGLFPHFGYSHFKVFHPILHELAVRGHQVTVVGFLKNPQPHPNYEELLLRGKDIMNFGTFDQFNPTRSLAIVIKENFLLHHEGQGSCKMLYESEHVEEILQRHKSKPYDLVITEFFNTDCHLGIAAVLQVPIVGLSSCALMPYYYDRIALPNFPSYVQSEYVGFPEQLNWRERIFNFLQVHINNLLYRYYTNWQDNQVIKKYLNIDMDVNEYAKTATSLIFVNQHYTLSGNQPKTAQLVEIGGIHINEKLVNASLPQEISTFLETVPATQGVLFISWGSIMRGSSVPKPKLNAILEVLQKLPMKVIWKWETDEKPIESPQFLFIKWAPQLTLLCHPKVKIFWGHGGLLGTTEAVHCGKPLILSPIYGDQFLNAYAVENRQVGKIVYHSDIEKAGVLERALKDAMSPEYAVNALALSQTFRNRENPPLKSSIWWIEHLLQGDGKMAERVLHTKAVHLNWFVYYSLDSALIVLVAVVIIIICLKKIVQILCRACKRQTNGTKIQAKTKVKKN